MNRTVVRVAAICMAAAALSGCEYRGLNSLALPGAPGLGQRTYAVTVELPDADGLVPNAEVKVHDVSVGVIRRLELSGWHARATVVLNSDVDLPANAVARVGLKSLLGSSYLELSAPDDRPAEGRLRAGTLVHVAPDGNYPQTEQVLASTSALLNGGGIGQIDTITRELNHALSGRTGTARDLLTQLNTFVDSLSAERTHIVSAMDGLNTLSGRLNQQTSTVRTALDTIPPALDVLDRNEQRTTHALRSLDRLSDVGTAVIRTSREDLLANLRDLRPVLHQLSDAGDALTGSLIVAGTGIFPVTTADDVVRGDYLNVDVTLDLTNPSLDRNFLTGTPLGGLFTGGITLPDEGSAPAPPGLPYPDERRTGDQPALPAPDALKDVVPSPLVQRGTR